MWTQAGPRTPSASIIEPPKGCAARARTRPPPSLLSVASTSAGAASSIPAHHPSSSAKSISPVSPGSAAFAAFVFHASAHFPHLWIGLWINQRNTCKQATSGAETGPSSPPAPEEIPAVSGHLLRPRLWKTVVALVTMAVLCDRWLTSCIAILRLPRDSGSLMNTSAYTSQTSEGLPADRVNSRVLNPLPRRPQDCTLRGGGATASNMASRPSRR